MNKTKGFVSENEGANKAQPATSCSAQPDPASAGAQQLCSLQQHLEGGDQHQEKLFPGGGGSQQSWGQAKGK